MILIKVVHVDVWHILGLYSAASERFPVEIFKPWMRLELICALFVSNTVCRFALYALINEICCLFIPALWYVILFYCYLSAEDLITYVLPSLAFIGALSHHALVSDDSDSKVVSSQAMVLSAHDLWGHVARCSARLARIVRTNYPRDAKIRQPQIALVVEDEVFRLDIPMDDHVGMDSPQGVH